MLSAIEAAQFNHTLSMTFQLTLLVGLVVGGLLGWSLCTVLRNWMDGPKPYDGV